MIGRHVGVEEPAAATAVVRDNELVASAYVKHDGVPEVETFALTEVFLEAVPLRGNVAFRNLGSFWRSVKFRKGRDSDEFMQGK